MRYRIAGPADDAEVRALLRQTPMAGHVQVTLEREPDHALAGTIEGDVHQTLIAREEGTQELAGVSARAVRDAWVGGAVTRLGYLSQLRVARDHRGSRRLIQRGYQAMEELHRESADCAFYVTTIMEDNAPARRLLEKGLAGFPTYSRIGELVTLVVPLHRRRRRLSDLEVRPVDATGEGEEPADLRAMVACLDRFGARHQFAPRWTVADLLSAERTRDLRPDDMVLARRGDAVVGCAALWDQRGFKQSVVRGYSPLLGRVRPLANLLARPLGIHRLPEVGEALRSAFVSHLAVDQDDPEVLRALLEALEDEALDRGLESLTLSLARGGPLFAHARRLLPHWAYTSVVYTVHWPDGAAAVAALREDPRPLHLDVAVL